MIRRVLAGNAVILFLLLTLSACGSRFAGLSLPGATTESMKALARGEWPAYAGTFRPLAPFVYPDFTQESVPLISLNA